MSLSPLDLLNITFRSLGKNPLRSALTALGVFMGVAAVSATLQVGNISRAVIGQQLAKRGAPQASIYPEWDSGGRTTPLKLEDMEFLQKRLVGLRAISAFNWAGSLPTIFQDKELTPPMSPVSQGFLLTSGKALVSGRFFSAEDFASYRPVVVIDKLLAEQLFGGHKPLGQMIYAGDRPYVVVGVVATSLDENAPPSGQLYVPMSVYNALTGSRDIGSIQMRPYKLQDVENLSNQAEELLKQRFPSQKFKSWNNVSDILEQQKTLEMASQGLAVVGVIALLVGGVGIANIMIASVAERTAEIGLRRAIGATQQEIMLQFILEATLLSLIGGTVGLGVVHGLTIVVTNTFNLPYEFDGSIARLALGSALVVGVGASLTPALRASQIDPVKALRSE
ncbi:MAG: ABC transporter permease [Brasilonema octagenarum HA4186-MV1]|jgi:putative ABC transport system permease protein|uniref:ABC transporter permease n=1 Tax=Brasilonema sennae CENA114 TaxID=415709 RepID=A0A856MJK6_9CYAN|nr:ABC transporter permease [Brasilonema sennae]MBW4625854.1 ABC transporter permease [Brasilonema octagenarum HA4186-MV1]QDL11503.1 ABC transporter permease [Brasilonema sennae CENA114]QDL17886.1 ABC transporter permease [Brasilonema octagenarum UFV-E1]